jgi:hypothetical protein
VWFAARHAVANFATFVCYYDFFNERQMRPSKEELMPVNFLQKQAAEHQRVTDKSGFETWHEILYAASSL